MIPTIGCSGPTLRVAVFAAGFSARLGRPKALVHIRGASLLQRTVRLLTPFCAAERLIVVVPPRSPRYRLGLNPAKVDFVVNARRGSGLSSSVRAGVKRARFSAAVLLLPVDLAELTTRDVSRLIARWRGARRQVVARRVEQHAGTPLILPRALYCASLDMAGDQGLRDIVRQLPPHRVRLVTLPSAEADVDTPQDLERARRHLLLAPAAARVQPRAFCTSR